MPPPGFTSNFSRNLSVCENVYTEMFVKNNNNRQYKVFYVLTLSGTKIQIMIRVIHERDLVPAHIRTLNHGAHA